MADDNLFEQLFQMLQSPGPVNWKVAREVTKSLAGEREPVEPHIAEEYAELAHAAELRIQAASDLPAPVPGELNPTDRATWAAENQQAFRVLVEPLSEKLSGGFEASMGSLAESSSGAMGSMSSMLAPLGPALLGVQAGTMVGFMAHRVLGQFDTGIPALDHGRPYLVVPNVEDFAADNGIDPRQVRLWAALHEMVFHRLMKIEWLRGHFVSVVQAFYDTVEFDVAGIIGKLSSLEDPGQLESLLGEEGGEAGEGLLKSESDPEKLGEVQSFTAFVEGYGDHVVRRAGADLLPDLGEIEEAQARRRVEPDQAEQYLQQLSGLSLERHRAADAAEFCAEVIRRWGEPALDKIWEEPNYLPQLAELTDPVGWAARVLLD
jgi:putative hydrolase